MTLTKLVILILIVITAGCTSNSIKPAPDVIQVPEKYYVPIPPEYTQDCVIDVPHFDADYLPLGIKHLAELRRISLENCNKDKQHIRNIQGTAVPKDK